MNRRALLAAALATVAAAPIEAELWHRWEKHDDASAATIDYAAWGGFLRRYLRGDTADGVARIAYGAVTPQDRTGLQNEVDRLAAIPIDRYTSPEQQAYWINLYNAMTVLVVLLHYPVASIRDIALTPGVFGLFGSVGPWAKKLVRVEDVPISLDDIENRILRPIWRDPRVHYALTYAAVGSPSLPPQPFTPEEMGPLLDAGASAFVNSPRGVRIDEKGLIVSSIYVWFKEDFGGSDHGVIAHLKRFADAPLQTRLATVDRIAGDQFDWALADAGHAA